jgi:hypothetical protein
VRDLIRECGVDRNDADHLMVSAASRRAGGATARSALGAFTTDVDAHVASRIYTIAFFPGAPAGRALPAVLRRDPPLVVDT